jgi:glyoxylase-like metal-dependent hydrolase (beta-lactamase superfamily II)
MKILSLPPLDGDYRFAKPLAWYLDPTNSYLIVSEKNNAAIVDAPGKVDFILDYLRERDLTLTKILITHAHGEHIFGLKELAERTGAEVCIHKGDEEELKNPKNYSVELIQFLDYTPYDGPVHLLEDGEIIPLDEVDIKVMHVPGHSAGSAMFIAGNAIFSGDVLSHNAVGHHNMFGGDRADMRRSLEKIKAIEGDYDVYPAHWTTTTLRDEQEGNLAGLPIIRLSAMIKLGGQS